MPAFCLTRSIMEAAAADACGNMVSRLMLLGYNMLRPEEVACGLVWGRENFAAGRLEDANSNFAYAYQMRCTADWVWVNVLGRKVRERLVGPISRGSGAVCEHER